MKIQSIDCAVTNIPIYVMSSPMANYGHGQLSIFFCFKLDILGCFLDFSYVIFFTGFAIHYSLEAIYKCKYF